MLEKQMNHPAASSGELGPNRFKGAALWWVVGGQVCALINLVLVLRFSYQGAAIAQSLSFAFLSLWIRAISQSKYLFNWIGADLRLSCL